ncbi:uncharacterized protein BDV17DRAFT_44555 [Aspergillus undulatus]|uniref:uncharacterized protein n=1 Tax=Aspergillus undulatus TaxID=1810928 RepID=UPI003CCDAB9F
MSTGPPVWSAQDEHESRSPAETRPRRSRRKKDDDAEVDRKEPATKSSRSKKEDKDKAKEKEKENLKEKEKDNDKEKESKRSTRRPRDKSASISNNPTSPQSTPSNPRKKPKLEVTPPKQSPDTAPAPAAPAAVLGAPASTPVSAPATTASVPTPKPSPLIASTPPAANHTPHPPQSQIPPPRSQATSQLPLASEPTPPQAPAPTTSPPYPTMVSAPPSRPQSQPLAPPQRSSGQNYDPIRSAFGTNSSAPPPSSAPAPPSFSPPARPVSPRPFRASASPAISSLIDAPQNTSPQYAPRPYGSPSRGASSYPSTPAASHVAPAHSTLTPSAQYGHPSPYGPPAQTLPSQDNQVHARLSSSQPQMPPALPEAILPVTHNHQIPSGPTPMEVDGQNPPPTATEKPPKKESKSSTAPASKQLSPKSSRPAKEAPILPQGSGLIQNALFGGDDNSSSTPSQQIPNIIVHIPLQRNTNRIVNFARLAEEQYGFAALHPRLAAHKERMAAVAAAGAALERNDRLKRGLSAGESADEDLSLEVDRDSEVDGDGAMSAAAAQTDEPIKKRKKKGEDYDRDDPFVDDSEMVWQEQAAASKDGFFVYSGPLVSEGEKVQVERYVLGLTSCIQEYQTDILDLGRMEQSNEDEDEGAAGAVEVLRQPMHSYRWLLQFQYLKRQVFLYAVPGQEAAISTASLVRGNQSRIKREAQHRMDEVGVVLVAVVRTALEEARHRWWSWHLDLASHRLPLG